MEIKKLVVSVLKVILLFFIFELVIKLVGSTITKEVWETINVGKYSVSALGEIVVLLLALIVVVVKNKWYIFKEKRVSFSKTVTMCIPILVISLLVFVSNYFSLGGKINLENLLSLIVYTISIGLFEEIFFRGIIQNEIVDSYKNNLKQVIISIAASSIIFGAVHLTNMFYGQDFLTTIMQLIQTTSVGFLFGSVYFVTKNIWGLIFLHGFYDFSVLLMSVNAIKDCGYVKNVPINITIHSLIASLILSGIYILFSLTILKRSNVYEVLDIEIKEEDKLLDKKRCNIFTKLIWILLGGYFLFNFIYMATTPDIDKYYICYNYDVKKINKKELHFYGYDDYEINTLDGTINVYKKNNEVIIKDSVNKIKLDIKDVVRVVVVDKSIMVIAGLNNEYKLYYSNYLETNNNLGNIRNSFKNFDIPASSSIGYLKDGENNIRYPMIKSTIEDIFIIDNDKIYLVK